MKPWGAEVRPPGCGCPRPITREDRFLMDTTRGSTRLPGRSGNRIARVGIVGCLALTALAGCAPAPGMSGSPAGGDRVVLLVSATTHEPRPTPTAHART